MYGANTTCQDLQETQCSNYDEIFDDYDCHFHNDFHHEYFPGNDHNHVHRRTSHHHEHWLVDVCWRSLIRQHYALNTYTNMYGP